MSSALLNYLSVEEKERAKLIKLREEQAENAFLRKKRQRKNKILKDSSITLRKTIYEPLKHRQGEQKFQRKLQPVLDRELKAFQVSNTLGNKPEKIFSVKWDAKSQSKAERRLNQSELLKPVLESTGNLNDEEDVFSSTAISSFSGQTSGKMAKSQNNSKCTSLRKMQQEDILKEVDVQTKKKIFDIQLKQKGPYYTQYTSSSRQVLLAGKQGHIAVFNWRKFTLNHEIFFNDVIQDVKWMMENKFYAVAQKKKTFIYDDSGAEIHCCHDFDNVSMLSYLPYHFLLAGATSRGDVIYKDITMSGKNVANVKVGLDTSCLNQNPFNAILCLGHLNGTVSMITPNDPPKKPVISMLCHGGPLSHLVCDSGGLLMMTASVDKSLKIFDIRKTFEAVHVMKFPVSSSSVRSMAISQKNILAVGFERSIQLWKSFDQGRPYMTVDLPVADGGAILTQGSSSLCFCPFEDILGIGHSRGMTSAIVPGSGEPNFDSNLPNPYSSDKMIVEWNTKSLLEKIPYDMISLDPNVIGTSGERKEDYTYSKLVEIDEQLKKRLDDIGIVQKKKDQRKITDRDELRNLLLEKHEKLKQMKIGKEWWKTGSKSALDRFATGKLRKTHTSAIGNGEEENYFAESDNNSSSDDENEEADSKEKDDQNSARKVSHRPDTNGNSDLRNV